MRCVNLSEGRLTSINKHSTESSPPSVTGPYQPPHRDAAWAGGVADLEREFGTGRRDHQHVRGRAA
jgi:hypothetical protein